MPVPDYIRNLWAKVGHELLMSPSVTGVIVNAAGEVLLQRGGDNGLWSLPGGAIEPGEEPAEAVIREVWEETGLRVWPERIVGVYAGSANVVSIRMVTNSRLQISHSNARLLAANCVLTETKA